MRIFTQPFMPCHRMPERSLIIRGWQFPVCYRCMGILTGLLLAIPAAWFVTPEGLGTSMIIVMMLTVPLLLDGFTQKWRWRTSTNGLRLFTGVLCGTGLATFIVWSAREVVRLIMMVTGA
ncbi:DUF2085 domain-containing protein [Bacillus sp. KH172YL63]|uniref:DUF2085 domain-containing protein n=1 Tax=Bacillus sp. KH172YL63 TaxID=2709784 RepID=UPI0013E48DB7|nr:DUF2085 domain-containing protein [Bacillus sp. KH172YL63]BCB04395.1 hypothetical protein KH172YL63_25280 [Bacillus sp. KH172YL63]